MTTEHHPPSTYLRRRIVLAVYWLALAAGSHWPKLELFPPPEHEPIFQLDKGMHVLAFAGLVWLLIRARIAGPGATRAWTVAVAGAVAILYAGVDELTQHWTQRDVTLSDFAASAVGALTVVLMATPAARQAPSLRRVRAMRLAFLVCAAVVFVLSLPPIVNDVIDWSVRLFTRPWLGMDKAGHFVIAAGLTWLLASSFPAGVSRPSRGVLVTILVMGLSAPMMELAQAYSGRGVEAADVLAHELGLLAAMTVWALISTRRALRRVGLTERAE